ncbi:MAG TPA: methyltransferase domain-containing protein [Acidimicrobiia bacterium]|nr:methyltransferase domain-containing protein [Acidimicrobiia bacterium]
MDDDVNQLAMTHRLPRARVVNRIEYLTELAAGKRVVHIGFADAGFASMQEASGTWLHGHLAQVAAYLVGVDVDEAGVAEARRRGFEAYAVDCRRPDAIRALGLPPADLVIAGEVIEHLDEPGPFLDGVHAFLAPDRGELAVTTPNASGILNGFAALVGYEINHPDHVMMYSWRTLENLLARHGWEIVATRTFVPTIKRYHNKGVKMRVLAGGVRTVLWAERTIGRMWAPYVSDGLIVVTRQTSSAGESSRDSSRSTS